MYMQLDFPLTPELMLNSTEMRKKMQHDVPDYLHDRGSGYEELTLHQNIQ